MSSSSRLISGAGWVDYLEGLVHLERADAHAAVRAISRAAKASARVEIAIAMAWAESMSDTSEHLPSFSKGTRSLGQILMTVTS